MIKRVGFIVLFLVVFMSVGLFAQEATGMEVDLTPLQEAAGVIFLTGIGGMGVTALVSVIKRMLNAQGIFVILISIVVSAAAVLIWLIPQGFVVWKFLVLTVLVSMAANGIYLIPYKRTA